MRFIKDLQYTVNPFMENAFLVLTNKPPKDIQHVNLPEKLNNDTYYCNKMKHSLTDKIFISYMKTIKKKDILDPEVIFHTINISKGCGYRC